MEYPGHVTAWLRNLAIETDDEKRQELGSLRARADPSTPPRRVSVPQLVDDDVSPISTVFSDRSVFDTPVRKLQHRGGDLGDDVSDTTSIDDYEPDFQDKNEIRISLLKPQKQLITPPPSENSDNPPSTAASVLDNSNLERERDDPTTPRAVNITSCLQCTLSHLPCSRTPPSCTRCVRNGSADVCLLTRRLFPEELVHVEGRIVPLKILGEGEEGWRKKGEVREELMTQWRDEQDRRNWVLPSWTGGKGGENGKNGGGGMWEGEGRVVYRELCVELGGGV